MKNRNRTLVSLALATVTLVVMATGALAFLRPFSLSVVSVHTVFGLCFALMVIWHLRNNLPDFKRYLRSKLTVLCAVAAIGLAVAILTEVPPVRAFMALSSNTGPSPATTVDEEEQFTFVYEVAQDYVIELIIRKGPTYTEPLPKMAIWLENGSAYHIHTLHVSDHESLEEHLPYWSFKRREWQKAKDAFEATDGVDAVSEASKNFSFDPKDYILPATDSYSLMMEIHAPGMDVSAFDSTSSSLVYSVKINNANPAHFQMMEELGPPVEDEEQQEWQISYDLSSLTGTRDLLDSILVTVRRKNPDEK